MQITNSLMGAGLSAFQNGQQRVEQAASSIASASAPALGNSRAVADLTEELIQLKLGEHTAKLGTRMIQSADSARYADRHSGLIEASRSPFSCCERAALPGACSAVSRSLSGSPSLTPPRQVIATMHFQ